MGEIIPFMIPGSGSLDPETTAVVVRAYERACAELHDTGQPPVVRDVIARRLIEIAGRGERDVEQLWRAAFESLGLASKE